MENIAEINQHLLRFSPDALIVVNDRHQICFANETTFELFGYVAADLIGQPLEVLVPERLRSRHGDYVSAFMRNPSNREMGVRAADLMARRQDGTEFPAGIRLSSFNVKGRTYVAAAIRDITESRRISEQLIAAHEEADRANRAKSRFLATASHDLRQPLQAVRLLNGSLLKIAQDAEVKDLIEQQSDAIDGMARLLNALLDISRLESGSVEPQHAQVYLNDLFGELRAEFEPVARARELQLHIDHSEVTLRTDPMLLHQLLENVLGNAIKYTDTGRIDLHCEMKPDELFIAVVDSGIGIPEDKIARIFDEYYQVDIHGARRAGVGLGLAIVREVARVLGYSIKVTSQVGVGTQVVIRIPAQAVIADATRGSVTAPMEASNTAVEHRPRLVLIEDNDGVRRATELFLQLEGFEISSGSAAADVDRLLEKPCGDEVLIVDFHLDGANTGIDVVRSIRARSQLEIPAIVMSGDLPAALRTLKEPLARSRFLSKPVVIGDLLVAIQELANP